MGQTDGRRLYTSPLGTIIMFVRGIYFILSSEINAYQKKSKSDINHQ